MNDAEATVSGEDCLGTPEARALARQLFKCRAILANANAFQDLFWDVMKAKHGQKFATVSPQGRKGDGGNDGYHTVDKHYYQVFAPVDPMDKVTTAVAKLSDDFSKVKSQWGGEKGSGLRKYSFVFNDKYQGAPKDIELKLDTLRKTHPGIELSQYCCRDLEADFMSLPAGEWDGVLGGAIPDPSRVMMLDYTVLGEVIRHILAADVPESAARLDLPPELEQKIKLNDLSEVAAARIQYGALLNGRIERYFEANSPFARDELRDRVVGVFEAAKASVARDGPPANESIADRVFLLFRRNLFPRNASVATAIAVDAVVGYYFEACDVFDPHALEDQPGASP
jgi:hypothetical protein